MGQHEDTMDAQKVFSKTIKHYTTSIIADISASDILAYLATMKFGSGKWNGTAVSLIYHWQEQARLYDDIVGRTNSLTDIVKLTLLKNSVSLVPELRAVQTTADQLKAAPGNTLQTYDQYCTLLISAATTYDDNIKRSSGFPGLVVGSTKTS